MPDEMTQRTLHGDEETGDPNDRDVVGNTDINESPPGRAEAKNDTRSKDNRNG